jgi:Ni,Fe-hydrogenase III small subunit
MWEVLRKPLQLGVLAGRPDVPPAGLPAVPRAESGEIEVTGEALRVEIHRLFGGSLRLRHVPCGSCNACESELLALLGPFADVQRFGIDLVASPRHADGLLVTGPVSRHLEEALRITDEATPRPRLVIAVGDCACDGGFCAGSFATRRGVGDVLSVDVRIPGCPPNPEAIVHALLVAIGREHVRGVARAE